MLLVFLVKDIPYSIKIWNFRALSLGRYPLEKRVQKTEIYDIWIMRDYENNCILTTVFRLHSYCWEINLEWSVILTFDVLWLYSLLPRQPTDIVVSVHTWAITQSCYAKWSLPNLALIVLSSQSNFLMANSQIRPLITLTCVHVDGIQWNISTQPFL